MTTAVGIVQAAVKAAAVKADIAADPQKAKQKQQQAIRNARSYRKSKGRINWTDADIAADAADTVKAKKDEKAADIAADPQKAKQKQQQVIWNARSYRKSKGRINWTDADIAADAADTENLFAAEEKASAAAAADIAADPQKAKRKQQRAIQNKRARKKAKDNRNNS